MTFFLIVKFCSLFSRWGGGGKQATLGLGGGGGMALNAPPGSANAGGKMCGCVDYGWGLDCGQRCGLAVQVGGDVYTAVSKWVVTSKDDQ